MCANKVQYSTKRTLYAIISRQMTKTVNDFTQQWNLDFNIDLCEWGPIFDETHLVCNHFTANDQNRGLFHTTVKFGFQYRCVRIRSNIGRYAPCMQSFHGKWPKPWTISHNSEIWISISMCANETQYSTKRTLYAIISRQMTKTVDYFTKQWNLVVNIDVC